MPPPGVPGLGGRDGSARLAVLSVAPSSFYLVSQWARRAGHEIVLAVTKPGRPGGRRPGAQVAAVADPSTAVVVTPRVADCAGLLSELDVDLGIICAFSWVPSAVADRPRQGMVNLHPAMLPEYPGPNPHRGLYEGEQVVGYTLHRVVDRLDAGAILAQVACDLPAEVTPETVSTTWAATLSAVLDAGIPKALAGEPGEPQGPGSGTAATAFTDEECELDWSLPARRLQAQATALALAGLQPRGRIGEEVRPLRQVRALPGVRDCRQDYGGADAPRRGPIPLGSQRALVAVQDGVVEVELGTVPT